MKKNSLFLGTLAAMLTLGLIFTGCGKDDEEGSDARVALTAGAAVGADAADTSASVTFTGATGLTLTAADFEVTTGGTIDSATVTADNADVTVSFSPNASTTAENTYTVSIAAASTLIKGDATVVITQAADKPAFAGTAPSVTTAAPTGAEVKIDTVAGAAVGATKLTFTVADPATNAYATLEYAFAATMPAASATGTTLPGTSGTITADIPATAGKVYIRVKESATNKASAWVEGPTVVLQTAAGKLAADLGTGASVTAAAEVTIGSSASITLTTDVTVPTGVVLVIDTAATLGGTNVINLATFILTIDGTVSTTQAVSFWTTFTVAGSAKVVVNANGIIKQGSNDEYGINNGTKSDFIVTATGSFIEYAASGAVSINGAVSLGTAANTNGEVTITKAVTVENGATLTVPQSNKLYLQTAATLILKGGATLEAGGTASDLFLGAGSVTKIGGSTIDSAKLTATGTTWTLSAADSSASVDAILGNTKISVGNGSLALTVAANAGSDAAGKIVVDTATVEKVVFTGDASVW
jgi:hypothetical protein